VFLLKANLGVTGVTMWQKLLDKKSISSLNFVPSQIPKLQSH
jgi:hypothetical protein